MPKLPVTMRAERQPELASRAVKSLAGSGSPAGAIRDRIKEMRRVRAGDLVKNPKNWRTHGPGQRSALANLLQEVGYAQCLVTRELDDGRLLLIDGHLRSELDPDQIVPVVVLDVDEAEADKLLARLDPIGAMAGVSRGKLDALLKGSVREQEKMTEIIEEIAEKTGAGLEHFGELPSLKDDEDGAIPDVVPLPGSERDPAMTGDSPSAIFVMQEDVIFESNLPYGIPPLRPDRLSSFVPDRTCWKELPEGLGGFCVYGKRRYEPELRSRSALSYAVDDFLFERLWDEAATECRKIIQQGWKAVVSPDFSMWIEDPLAVQIWNNYRSYWVGRYWQEAGLEIIPTINWSDEKSYDFCFAAIPSGTPVISVQAQTLLNTPRSRTLFVDGLNEAIRRIQPGTVLVYSGQRQRHWIEPAMPSHVQFVWLRHWKDCSDGISNFAEPD